MKGRVPGLIKRIIAALSNKTNELRTRVMIFFLLHSNRSLLVDRMHAVVGGRHAQRRAAGQPLRYCGDEKDDDVEHGGGVGGRRRGGGGEGESFIMYMNREAALDAVTEPARTEPVPEQVFAYTQENPEEISRDLTHTLFKESEEEMELTDNEDGTNYGRGNATTNKMLTIWEDNVRSLDEEADEGDIDHAADLFIERFRRQIRLQKQESLQERHHLAAMLQ